MMYAAYFSGTTSTSIEIHILTTTTSENRSVNGSFHPVLVEEVKKGVKAVT